MSEIGEIKTAIDLMDSMIRSGEDHSERSLAILTEARKQLGALTTGSCDMSDLSISTVRSQLITKHYDLIKERDGWYSPDQNNLDDMNREITRIANSIESLDKIVSFTQGW